jgi:murein DD-endopeptidase MepM/ murein hydrolase activator NlpD
MTQGWANERTRKDPTDHYHRGVDIRAAVGDPVYSIGDGVVKYVRSDYAGSTAGNWIGVIHEGEMLSRYIHLSKILVSVSQRVSKGQQIGLAGSTGSSTPHLHLDVNLPESRLAEYVALFRSPTSGFKASDFGYKVPVEPLIPVDQYQSDVILGAGRQGIALYTQVPRGGAGGGSGTVIAVLGLLALAGAGVYYVRSRRIWV